MNNFDNTNRGALWTNEKRQNDKQPALRGDLNVNGVEYWVSAWPATKQQLAENPKRPRLSFQIESKADALARQQGVHNTGMANAQAQLEQPSQPQPVNEDSWDDDIPF